MSENGILAEVPGEYVSRASDDLPYAELAEDREYIAEIDAGHAGRVRIFYRKQKVKKGKYSNVFWLAVRAERIT